VPWCTTVPASGHELADQTAKKAALNKINMDTKNLAHSKFSSEINSLFYIFFFQKMFINQILVIRVL
jgi:hypothetical protein